jgi:hypothetical protein
MPLSINSRRKGIKVSEKGHCEPNFAIGRIVPRCVRRKLSGPGEHSRIANAAAHDPEKLIVRFLRRMQSKLRSVGIKVHIGFVFSSSIRRAVAPGAIILEKFNARHQIFFGRRYGIRNPRRLMRRGCIDSHVRKCGFKARGRSIRVDRQQAEPRDHHKRQRQRQYSSDKSHHEFLHHALRKTLCAVRRAAHVNVSLVDFREISSPIRLRPCPLGGYR